MMREFELKIGLEMVKIIFKSDFFDDIDTDKWDCPHLEFRGKPISETGYRSHFFDKSQMNGKTIEEFAQNLAIELNQELVGKKRKKHNIVIPQRTKNNFNRNLWNNFITLKS